VDTDGLRDEPLETEREAAVRRHSVAERVEVRGERRLVESSLGERRLVVRVNVQTLAAGDDLEPAVEQVEAARPLRPVGVRVRVERTLPRREAFDEDELSMLGADAPLVLGRQARRRAR
jgi:hypothetical protein